MKLSRNYLIAALLIIALYLMFFRARASGYAPGRAPRGSRPPRGSMPPRGAKGPKTESEVAMDRLLGRS